MESNIEINNGDIIQFKNENNSRYWVAIHHSKCNMDNREKFRRNIADHTGYYLFSGIWYEGDILTDKPYGKCIEQLRKGMFPNIEIVGNIIKDFEKFKEMLV